MVWWSATANRLSLGDRKERRRNLRCLLVLERSMQIPCYFHQLLIGKGLKVVLVRRSLSLTVRLRVASTLDWESILRAIACMPQVN
ncbi:hypothetical protein [Nostoc sp. KVJ20]|uniref:hypothetical protein n=1 Tax=Nostoc sp. KVJ20 TaxID=457944 RepID=UPI00114D07DD|nr:hypothetical protein [Nostoc sp. KVJ20]